MTSPAARDDTLASIRRTAAAQENWPEGSAMESAAGEGNQKSADPRAAGATSLRGAQPPGRRPEPQTAAELEAALEALGDWRSLLDEELAEMAETTRRINRLSSRRES